MENLTILSKMAALGLVGRILFAASVCVAGSLRAVGAPASDLHSDLPPEGVETLDDVEIGAANGSVLRADLAWPKRSSKEPLPAVLWIHGGGWMASSRKEWAPWRLFLTARGYFTAETDYRLSGIAKWPAQLDDCKYAVRWLRANAARYNIDPNRIGCCGPSAGGHLVSCLGIMDEARFEGGEGYAGVSSRVQAVVDFCGPVNLTTFSPINLFGFPYKRNPDAYKDASPIFHVHPGVPPFLVVHGDKDRLVPYAQAVDFVAALQRVGAQVKLVTVAGGTHSLGQTEGKLATPAEWRPTMVTVVDFFDHNLK